MSTAVELVVAATAGRHDALPGMLAATEAEGGIEAVREVCDDLAGCIRQLIGMRDGTRADLRFVSAASRQQLDPSECDDPVAVSMMRFVCAHLNRDPETAGALFDAVPDEHKPDFTMRLLAMVVQTVHMRLDA